MPAVARRRSGLPGLAWRVLAVLALALGGVAAAATSASAHTSLESTSPKAGAVLQGAPAAVQLTFSEAVGQRAYLAVTGPQGRVDAGTAQVKGAVVAVRLDDGLPAGRYTVAFRVVSDDGHPVEDSYTFQVKAAATASPAPSTSTAAAAPTPTTAPPAAATAAVTSDATDHGNHWFMGFAGAAMVVAGAGALVWERRHRAPEESDGEAT